MRYFILTISLLVTEILIALYMHDSIIRPYGGDFLVVMLIYCFVMIFLHQPPVPVALGVLLFAYAVEVSQYFHVVVLLGLGHSRAANIILGNSFSWTDMLCYTLGILLVIVVEKASGPRRPKALKMV
jgi:hypothetical protein